MESKSHYFLKIIDYLDLESMQKERKIQEMVQLDHQHIPRLQEWCSYWKVVELDLLVDMGMDWCLEMVEQTINVEYKDLDLLLYMVVVWKMVVKRKKVVEQELVVVLVDLELCRATSLWCSIILIC